MITLAQRITELRTQKGMSRPELSLALGLPKTAVEKFETGRQTPTQEQQKKMAEEQAKKEQGAGGAPGTSPTDF